MPDVPLLGQDSARERAAANGQADPVAEETAPQVIPARCAIMVLVTPDGETVLANDINLPVVPERIASRDEAYGMLATALKDMQVEEAAVHTTRSVIANIEAKQQQAMQKMQNDGITNHIQQAGGFRGGLKRG